MNLKKIFLSTVLLMSFLNTTSYAMEDQPEIGEDLVENFLQDSGPDAWGEYQKADPELKKILYLSALEVLKNQENILKDSKKILDAMTYDEFVDYLVEQKDYVKNGGFLSWSAAEADEAKPQYRKNVNVQDIWHNNEAEEASLKVHVRGRPENITSIVKLVLPYLRAHKIEHKIINSFARCSNDTWSGETSKQRGKYITIYPKDNAQALQIMLDLDDLLFDAGFRPKDFIQPYVNAEGQPVENTPDDSKTKGVTWRTGGFYSQKLKITNEEGEEIIFEDDRNAPGKPPEMVNLGYISEASKIFKIPNKNQ